MEGQPSLKRARSSQLGANLITTVSSPPSPSPSSMSTLPIDIILAEILPKLPVKSLLRFKTVSKSFNIVISSPGFTCLHLRHSQSSEDLFIVFSNTSTDVYTYHLDSIPCTPSAKLQFPDGYMSVVGSCNGLILVTRLVKYKSPLVILNPSTRAYITVPFPSGVPGYVNIGFGFDDCSKDYKIVIHLKKTPRATMLYSVNSKTWKVVANNPNLDSMLVDYAGVLIDNHLLHWMSGNPLSYQCRIYCFDVRSEKWMDDLLFPDSVYDSKPLNYLINIGVLDGRLFFSFQNRVNKDSDVWVMKKYGVQESWTKLMTVAYTNDLPRGITPVACLGVGSNEVLLRHRLGSNQIWYNRKDKSMKMAEFTNLGPVEEPYAYKGSLVTLPGAVPIN